MTVGAAIEQSDRISYTFPLLPKEESISDILNLVFTVREGELIGMGVVVYYLTEEQRERLNGTEPVSVKVPMNYIPLDMEFKPVVVELTENSGGRHLTTRLAPPIFDGGSLGDVVITGGSGGSSSGPSFGVGGHNSSFGGNQGGYGGTGGPHGGGGSGATKPVTAPNEIIIDPSFENNKCLYSLYKKMNKGDWFNRRMKEFDKEMSVADLELKAGDSGKYKKFIPDNGKQRNAMTLHDNSERKVTIVINTEHLNRPNLSVARTLLHEMMHAEIYRVVWSHMTKSEGNDVYYDKADLKSNRDDFGEIIKYYEKYNYSNPKNTQHEYIAYYRSWMILSLAEYADNNDIDYDIELLEALSWEGLKRTDEWKNTPNQEDIEQTLKDFNNDKSKANCQ